MSKRLISSLAIIAVAALLVVTRSAVNAQVQDKAEAALKAAMDKETLDGDLKGAIEQYKKLGESNNKSVAARALVRMGQAYEKKLGHADARKAYQQVLTRFGDQKESVDQARARLAALQAPTASATKQTTRLIWTGAVRGTPSPDGRYYSFVDPETGDMAVRDLSAGTNRRLTSIEKPWSEYAADSVFSADNRQVAYIFYADKKPTELRVTSIAAGEPVRTMVVPRNQDDYRSPVGWMPDGKRLLVIRSLADGIAQIGILTIRDGSFRNIKSFPKWSYPGNASLSPDGRYVAYDMPTVENGSPHDIFVLATDGGVQTRVARDPANDSAPVWSPDGSQLLFLSNRSGNTALWAVPIKDGRANDAAVLIKADIGNNLLGLTKSGSLYYFSVTGGSPTNLYAAELESRQGPKPPVPATARLINTNIGATFSRDGEHLAYYSFRGDSIKLLVTRSVKTGEEQTVNLPARVVSRFSAGPKWFPDNRSVLVESADAEGPGCGFYRLALDTGNIELLTNLSRNVSAYDLSPDGRTIFYAIETPDHQRLLMRFDIDSHRETVLRSVPDGSPNAEVVSVAISPDGVQLATTLIGGVVEVRPVAGGQAREIFRPPDQEGTSTSWQRQALAWTADQRYLLFVGDGGDLWRVPVPGGQAEKVGIPMKNIKNLAVHPDGKQIVFDGNAPGGKGEVRALENFLPPATAKN